MNKILIIVFGSFCIISNAMAQNNKIQDHCKRLPMKAGDITYLASDTTRHQPANSFIVSSTNKEVLSLTQGRVEVVLHLSNKEYQTVGVSYNYTADTVIVYSMLSEVSVKQGDTINKGDIIGKAMPNKKTGKNEAAIEVKDFLKAKKLTDAQVMSFIKRADN